mgnify:CR=1 FL=1|tara:strand:- start:193702 stop:194262 length:561 start_codon:yes stop_codon:yes gene_type:complete
MQPPVQQRLGVALILFFSLMSSIAVAATVYKTVDEKGVVSYSDTPPAEEVPVETLVIDVQAPELSDTAQEQWQALRETTDRMVADRQQREKHRAEMREQQAQSQAPPQVAEYTEPGFNNGTSRAYYPYPVYRPVRRPRPVHPIARPPLRHQVPAHTPAGVISPGYDYPASLVRRGYSPQVRAAFEK